MYLFFQHWSSLLLWQKHFYRFFFSFLNETTSVSLEMWQQAEGCSGGGSSECVCAFNTMFVLQQRADRWPGLFSVYGWTVPLLSLIVVTAHHAVVSVSLAWSEDRNSLQLQDYYSLEKLPFLLQLLPFAGIATASELTGKILKIQSFLTQLGLWPTASGPQLWPLSYCSS